MASGGTLVLHGCRRGGTDGGAQARKQSRGAAQSWEEGRVRVVAAPTASADPTSRGGAHERATRRTAGRAGCAQK